VIAVIDAKGKCVWGLGKTPDEAWKDARVSIASKIPEIRPVWSELSLANIAPEAEGHWDGLMMWQWVIQDQKAGNPEPAMQAELF